MRPHESFRTGALVLGSVDVLASGAILARCVVAWLLENFIHNTKERNQIEKSSKPHMPPLMPNFRENVQDIFKQLQRYVIVAVPETRSERISTFCHYHVVVRERKEKGEM